MNFLKKIIALALSIPLVASNVGDRVPSLLSKCVMVAAQPKNLNLYRFFENDKAVHKRFADIPLELRTIVAQNAIQKMNGVEGWQQTTSINIGNVISILTPEFIIAQEVHPEELDDLLFAIYKENNNRFYNTDSYRELLLNQGVQGPYYLYLGQIAGPANTKCKYPQELSKVLVERLDANLQEYIDFDNHCRYRRDPSLPLFNALAAKYQKEEIKQRLRSRFYSPEESLQMIQQSKLTLEKKELYEAICHFMIAGVPDSRISKLKKPFFDDVIKNVLYFTFTQNKDRFFEIASTYNFLNKQPSFDDLRMIFERSHKVAANDNEKVISLITDPYSIVRTKVLLQVYNAKAVTKKIIKQDIALIDAQKQVIEESFINDLILNRPTVLEELLQHYKAYKNNLVITDKMIALAMQNKASKALIDSMIEYVGKSCVQDWMAEYLKNYPISAVQLKKIGQCINVRKITIDFNQLVALHPCPQVFDLAVYCGHADLAQEHRKRLASEREAFDGETNDFLADLGLVAQVSKRQRQLLETPGAQGQLTIPGYQYAAAQAQDESDSDVDDDMEVA